MSVFVTGGTGTVGSFAVQQLVARGVETSVLTRSEEEARCLPAGARPVVMQNDYRQKESVLGKMPTGE